MQFTVEFVIFLVASYGLAFIAWPALKLHRIPTAPKFLFALLVMFTPLVIAREAILLRAVACVLAVDLFFKMADYVRYARTSIGLENSFGRYAILLIPFPVFCVHVDRRPCRTKFDVSRLKMTVVGSLFFAACFASLKLLNQIGLLNSSFMLDHTCKFVLFPFAWQSISHAIRGIEESLGYRLPPIVDRPYAARSVAEFWRRLNTRVHSWLKHNVYRPLGGRRIPFPALLATFVISGVFHEIAFAVATSRIDGYQFAFFAIQPVAIASPYILPRRARSCIGKFAGYPLTVAWLWATSMLFFHGVDRVFPFFYAAQPWLP